MSKKNSIPDDFRVVWTVSRFPLKLKNALASMAKMKQQTIPTLLEEIIIKSIKEQGYGHLLD